MEVATPYCSAHACNCKYGWDPFITQRVEKNINKKQKGNDKFAQDFFDESDAPEFIKIASMSSQNLVFI